MVHFRPVNCCVDISVSINKRRVHPGTRLLKYCATLIERLFDQYQLFNVLCLSGFEMGEIHPRSQSRGVEG